MCRGIVVYNRKHKEDYLYSYYKPAAIVYLLVIGYLNNDANSLLNGMGIRIHLATPA